MLIPVAMMLLVAMAIVLLVNNLSPPTAPTLTPMSTLAEPPSQAFMLPQHASVVHHGGVGNGPDYDAQPWMDPSATAAVMGSDQEPTAVAMEDLYAAADGLALIGDGAHHMPVADMSDSLFDQAQGHLAAAGTDGPSADSGGASTTHLLAGPAVADDATSTGTGVALVSSKQSPALSCTLEADSLQGTTSSTSVTIAATAMDPTMDNPKPRHFTPTEPSVAGPKMMSDSSSTAAAPLSDAAPEDSGTDELSMRQLASPATAVVAPEVKAHPIAGSPVDTAAALTDAAMSNTGEDSLASSLARHEDTAMSAVVSTGTVQISARSALAPPPGNSDIPPVADERMHFCDRSSASASSADPGPYRPHAKPSCNIGPQAPMHQQRVSIAAHSQPEDAVISRFHDSEPRATQTQHANSQTQACPDSSPIVSAATAQDLQPTFQDAVDFITTTVTQQSFSVYHDAPLHAALHADQESMESDEEVGPKQRRDPVLDQHACSDVTAVDAVLLSAQPSGTGITHIPFQPLPGVAELQHVDCKKEQLTAIGAAAKTAEAVAAAADPAYEITAGLSDFKYWLAEDNERLCWSSEDHNAALAAEMAAMVALAESSTAEALRLADSGFGLQQASLHCLTDQCATTSHPDCPSPACAEPAEASSTVVPPALFPRASVHGSAAAGMRVSDGTASQKAAQYPAHPQSLWHDQGHHRGARMFAAPATAGLHVFTHVTTEIFVPKQHNLAVSAAAVAGEAIVGSEEWAKRYIGTRRIHAIEASWHDVARIPTGQGERHRQRCSDTQCMRLPGHCFGLFVCHMKH